MWHVRYWNPKMFGPGNVWASRNPKRCQAVSLAIDSQAVSLAIDSQAVSLAITEFRKTTSPPEPKFFVKFILGPEPDSRIRRKKLHTGHRSSQNRFFENLYKSLFPSLNMPGNPPEHAQIIPRSSPEPPKIDPKTAKNPGMLIVFPI